MTSTYNRQTQPIINWKELATYSAVPSWNYNGNNTSGNNGTPFKARPLKIWRRRLNGSNSQGTSAIGMPMDIPGGSVYLGSKDPCDDNNKRVTFINNIDQGTNCENCNPEAKVIKSASTNLNKNYYTDSRAYLQSRCKTYKQNQGTGLRIEGEAYVDSNKNVLEPSDSGSGPPYYESTTCNMGCDNDTNPKKIIYKPNNKNFSTQGAVSSGSRLLRLKVDTINANANSLSAFGEGAKNAGRYSSNTNAIYILKTKQNKVIPYRRTGDKQACDKCD
tara:strand:+ start:65 stop:889 length:825 start_codon:yes stop_codon:yes gene_type:complete